MAECHEVLGLIAKEDTYANLFVDLAKTSGDILDSYHWIGHDEVFNLAEVLRRIKDSAEAAVGEFEKVRAVRRATSDELTRVATQTRKIVSAIRARRFEQIDDFVKSLVDLRGVRGEIIALRDRRYIDLDSVGSLEAEVEENSRQVAENCVGFLLRPEALSPYEATVAEHRGKIDGLAKATDARALEKDVDQAAAELEMLIDVVSNLKIDDATQRTTIVDGISTIYAQLNQTRAALKNKIGDLGKGEAVAEFASQLKLLNQAVVNYLDVCDTPERCDEYLTKMMVQIEEMEGRFADYDEFVGQLTEKREEVYGAFEARKQQLVEARSRRAAALAQAAERILRGIKTRVESLKEVNEIHGYFASDLMIEKVRDIVEQLSDLGDAVRVDDIQSQLKTIREDAVRQLKDRKDLYEDGEKIIRLGNHRFAVNTQPFDLTTVVRDGDMHLHLTGTNFFEKIEDPELLATHEVWEQGFVSENNEVYRGEYLAFEIFRSLGSADVPEAEQLRSMNDDELVAFVQRFMGPRFAEGYVKGVHDHDAAILLRAILDMDATVGLLRYHPRARALAQVFWMQYADGRAKRTAAAAMKGFGAVREVFPATEQQRQYVADMRRLIADYVGDGSRFAPELIDEAGEYLFEELTRGGQFVVSRRAAGLFRDFHAHLDQKLRAERFRESLAEVRHDVNAAMLLAREWVLAFLVGRENASIERDYADEVAVALLGESLDPVRVVDASMIADLSGLVGNHRLIDGGVYRMNFNRFMLKLARYRAEVVPRFEAFTRLKKEIVDRRREEMRLDEFRPRVLTSFVRNKLIDEVYLPLIGDNLAKQAGVAGETKRTDRMGLLLLISPPGYGKTTLMEYIANRLGIIFMKINGPALGHHVTSIDPGAAPNAAAREELEKLNLAFEMGDNVMIYLDDIQHTNAELLQKFISLCDAQRKIEGVYRGKTRTYDFRGKKVVV
ncbi:MAG: AAA family ATPase, partial [Pirellulaceae bacterium]|nr:AAA family ATPase [Pirellulaceae bacterium]